MSVLQPIILAGGVGSRLWPLSTPELPKQFLTLFCGLSLFQMTVLRFSLDEAMPPIVITNNSYADLVKQQLAKINRSAKAVILEPCYRGTLAAIGLALQFLSGSDTFLVVMPADHILQLEEFKKLLYDAKKSLADAIITFGIKPNYPHTGYGYIQVEQNNAFLKKILHFKEKPDFALAAEYIKQDNFYWNSGIFVGKNKVFFDEYEKYAAQSLHYCSHALTAGKQEDNYIYINHESFYQHKTIAFDVAIMEKTESAMMIAADFSWSDVGEFNALWQAQAKDEKNNFTSGEVTLENTTNAFCVSNTKPIIIKDLQDIAVIENHTAILACSLKQSKLKNIRPWGYFSILHAAGCDGYQVKLLVVKPNCRTSLQYHNFRSEHWVVVSGRAKVTVGDNEFILDTNAHIYIDKLMIHRLENIGEAELKVVETQFGSHISEEDIVRIEDDFNRVVMHV